MSQYTFHYFNGRGRAEVSRLIFAAAGQQFTDVRIEKEQWPAFKPKAPTGQVPYLEVRENGKTLTLSQSVSIARFLARRFNLAGQGEYEQALVDMYADQVSDLINELVKAHFESDESRKEQLNAKVQSETLPNSLRLFEQRLAQTGTGYLVGNGLTYADLHLFATLEWLGDKRDQVLAHFPLVQKLDKTIRAHERIAAWIASRPATQM